MSGGAYSWLKGGSSSSSGSGASSGGSGSSGAYSWLGNSGASKPSGGSGSSDAGIGGFFHGVGHWIASKSSIAGHDIKAFPGATYGIVKTGAIEPWWNLVTTGHPYAHGQGKKIDKLVNEQSDAFASTINHPLRDPFSTALLALPAAHGLGRGLVGATEAGQALRAGEGLKSAAGHLANPELLRTPRMIKQPGGEPVSLATSRNAIRRLYQQGHDAYVQRAFAKNPEGRVAAYGASRMHGSLAEFSRARIRARQAVVANLRKSSERIGNVAKGSGLSLVNAPKTLAQASIELVSHNTTPEEAIIRAEHAIERGVNPELNASNVKLYGEIEKLGLTKTEGRTVGINPEFDSLAKAERALHQGATAIDTELADRGLRSSEQLANRRDLPAAVTQRLQPFEEEKVTPALRAARTDFQRVDRAYSKALAQEAKWRETNGGRLTPGGKHVEGTPEAANPYRNRVVQIGIRHEASLERMQKLEARNGNSVSPAAAVEHLPQDVTPEALATARENLPELLLRKFERRYGVERGQEWTPEQKAQFEQDMLGAAKGTVTDPELVRNLHQITESLPGRSFTPLTTLEPARVPGSPMAGARGSVIGEPRSPLNTHYTTGKGLLNGAHAADVVDSVARHWHNVNRFFNTQDWRDLINKTGSTSRRSTRDILSRVDNRTEAGVPIKPEKLSAEIEQMIGRKRSTAYTPEMEGEDAGVLASLQEYIDHLFPGRIPDSEMQKFEREAGIGTEAPKGYKWVDSNVVGDMNVLGGGGTHIIGRYADNVNAAITAATVYFKIGHITTRLFTNAATNIMQGSLTPWAIKRALSIWHALTPSERIESIAGAGTHYYEALPGAEGEGLISRTLQRGVPLTKSHVGSPQWWAGYIDSPFRFNSLAYAANKAGYEGIEGFRQFLSDWRNHNDLEPYQRARVAGVLRDGNREAIAYDRVNATEKAWLTRMIWFYPWVKGSTVFTASAMLEHPFKSAAIGQLGVAGRNQQQADFGDLPSYSYGVSLLARGSNLPLVTDLNTFNPEGTAGDLLQIPSHEGNLAGMLNPILGGVDRIAHSEDQYGNHTPHPLDAALSGMIAPSPEAQIASAYLGRNQDQSHREYPGGPQNDPFSKTWLGQVLRMLIGPASPRHFNPDAAHSLAQRERTGR